ncbi:alpha-1,6-mannanase [Flavobacterium zepuense]|uniref:Alpha-1,6-mannanase n=1 Tax=Flavobacterium zepuense TaxID=2593302 RepID=A0A552V4F7_9FLAO|nr:glycoside hydrolase family 76 protein [Flavobacterium zepuense]TRW25338.1 alpha-1,6-mannanase [Flavobacterium zepuense]
MKNFKIIYLFVLGAFFASCSDDDPTGPAFWDPDNSNVTPYTSADATVAYDAFNFQFYNPEAKLYYSTTEKGGLGSIWTQAIFWDISMDAYKRTNDPKYLALVGDIYQGAYNEYDGFNYNNTVEWFIYDDIMWWVISLGRAYELTHNEAYLQNSIAGFNHVWNGSYDPVDGGMFWDFAHSGKNACINYPTVIAAMKLYEITGDEEYLAKAIEIYEWSQDNLFQHSDGRVADNKIGDNAGFSDYTYNQGTCIGAAMALYKQTGNQSYLDDAILAADYTKNVMSDEDGILPAEGDWNEQGVLKAIFARYLMDLVNDGNQTQYLPWIRRNASIAWKNRDINRNIMYRDYDVQCPVLTIQSFEACSAVGIMQIAPPENN